MGGTRVGIIAALPREIAGLVRGVAADAELRRRGVWLYRVQGAVVVAAGMGAVRAALAVEAATACGEVTALWSVGVAGACDPGLRVGDVVRAGVVVDARTGERYGVPGSGEVLVTAGEVAGVAEKRRLFASYGASAVDMEAATVGRLAEAHGLEFGAIKAISDGAEFELPALGRFAGRYGSFRTGAFALHVAVRPWMWGKAVELGRGSEEALAGLEAAVKRVIAGGL